MRLYLSSYRLGAHPEELVRLAGPRARVAVIGNAVDGFPDGELRVARELADLAGLGLRRNVFTLRQAMRSSGADDLIMAALREDAVVPHVQSPDHPETAACDAVAEHYRSTGVPHVTLRDGQAMVVDGETTTVV